MDLNLARTFLAVVYEGSFVMAAERMCVTQTAVTARIKNLEEQVGTELFIRKPGGATLTKAGEQFIPVAQNLLNTWQNALKQLQQIPEPQLRLASEFSLCNPWLGSWCSELLQQQITVQSTIGEASLLLDSLEAGKLDVLLTHHPRYRPALQVEQLLEEKLILVASSAGQLPQPSIYIDWGLEFSRQYSQAFPDPSSVRLHTNHARMALDFMLEHGGSGYFRTHVVRQYLDSGRLYPVVAAPEFSLPIYVVYARSAGEQRCQYALELLARLADRLAGHPGLY